VRTGLLLFMGHSSTVGFRLFLVFMKPEIFSAYYIYKLIYKLSFSLSLHSQTVAIRVFTTPYLHIHHEPEFDSIELEWRARTQGEELRIGVSQARPSVGKATSGSRLDCQHDAYANHLPRGAGVDQSIMAAPPLAFRHRVSGNGYFYGCV